MGADFCDKSSKTSRKELNSVAVLAGQIKDGAYSMLIM